jgi:hypothetical protein
MSNLYNEKICVLNRSISIDWRLKSRRLWWAPIFAGVGRQRVLTEFLWKPLLGNVNFEDREDGSVSYGKILERQNFRVGHLLEQCPIAGLAY